jgi:hypothetical protein
VLAGDAAAGLEAEPQDLGPQLLHPLPPRLLATMEDGGWRLPSPAWKRSKPDVLLWLQCFAKRKVSLGKNNDTT